VYTQVAGSAPGQDPDFVSMAERGWEEAIGIEELEKRPLLYKDYI